MPPENSVVAILGWIARREGIAAKSHRGAAEDWLRANRVPERIIKAPVDAAGSGDGAIAADGTIISIGAWTDATRNTSVFSRLYSDNAIVKAPPNTPVGLITGAASGAKVDEGKGIPLSKVVLGNVMLTPQKAAVLIAATDSLLFDISAAGQAMLNRELASAIGAEVDKEFIALVTTGLTAITSTGSLADIRAAQLATNSVGQARLYWVASPDVGKLASTVSTANGGHAFVAASAAGGELAQLPFLISSGLASGTLVLLDGSGIAAWAAAPTMAVSQNVALEMSDAPTGSSVTPTATSLVSMFQTNSTAMRAVAEIAAARLHANAVSIVSGITGTTWTTT